MSRKFNKLNHFSAAIMPPYRFASRRIFVCIVLCQLVVIGPAPGQTGSPQRVADSTTYLQAVKGELAKQWPRNRTVNLVFHGHSVPAGYFDTPIVNTLAAYPHQFLKLLKAQYPYAVVNVIVTAIGGENSEQGAKRFRADVLTHQPDVIFIDYALNDAGIGLTRARQAWRLMIEQAQQANVRVILFTPTPDQRVDRTNPANPLRQHADQVIQLAKQYHTSLVNSHQLFEDKIQSGHPVSGYMSHVNHPNEAGHALIADELMRWFR